MYISACPHHLGSDFVTYLFHLDIWQCVIYIVPNSFYKFLKQIGVHERERLFFKMTTGCGSAFWGVQCLYPTYLTLQQLSPTPRLSVLINVITVYLCPKFKHNRDFLLPTASYSQLFTTSCWFYFLNIRTVSRFSSLYHSPRLGVCLLSTGNTNRCPFPWSFPLSFSLISNVTWLNQNLTVWGSRA